MSSAASYGSRRGSRRVSASRDDEYDWTILIGSKFCVCDLIGWESQHRYGNSKRFILLVLLVRTSACIFRGFQGL